MVFFGGYPVIERCCKILVALMTVSLAVAACLLHPDPAAILKAAVFPMLPADKGAYQAVLLVMSLVGTEAGSLTNVTYTYFLNAKGLRTEADLPRQRFDLLSSVSCILLLGTLVQVAAAASIHPLGITLKNANDLVRIFSESLGMLGRVIFSAGMWAAAFSGFIGGTTGYALIVTDIFRGRKGIEKPRRDPVFRAFVAFWCFSPLYVLFTKWEPVALVVILNALMVVLIPLLAIALMRLTNDRSRMGKYANGWVSNLCLATLIATSLWLMYRNFLH